MFKAIFSICNLQSAFSLRLCVSAVLLSLCNTQLVDADAPQIVLVIGAEGAPEFAEQFATWTDRWQKAAGQASAKITVIGSGKEQPTQTDESTTKAADKDRLHALLEAEAKTGQQPLWLVLIGHGTYGGGEAKFNLGGPDLSATELALWLKPFERPLAVINCTSSSGPFMNKLAAPGRIVVTATRSGSELNYARFGDYFSAAIADPAADLDKDGQTSLLEAYLAASHRVEEFYKQEARLATEHALLDDNGDGLGTPAAWFEGIRAVKRAKDGAPLDGSRAHQLHLVQSAREQSMPADLRKRRDDMELAVEALRDKKATMNEDEYFAKLEPLLVELAELYEKSEPGERGSLP
jgi:Sec-independent protein translocase protein TatA